MLRLYIKGVIKGKMRGFTIVYQDMPMPAPNAEKPPNLCRIPETPK
jgi:hypothetical protein